MLTSEELEILVLELAERPGHEKVRVLLHRLLVDGLGANSRDVDFEKQAPEVHGRIDALLGRTVIELKSDLRRERKDAEKGLVRYLSERENKTGEKFVGIATDGASFIAFFLRHDHVAEVGTYNTDPDTPRELLAWLQATVAIGDGLIPDPKSIIREFGRGSLAARRTLDKLNELWALVGQSSDVRLKRELWNRLLSIAYGDEVGDDDLFLQHTYLVVVAKAVAWAAMIDIPPPNAAALLHGKAFSDFGIVGQSEPDFFDWVLTVEDGADLVMRIMRQVERFRLGDIRIDILKALYESLIDPKTRHDLGEYYTPDWLAERMITAAVTDPLKQRVMDPACGSGTFLFHAVRAVLSAAKASGLTSVDAVRRATENIAGIDIHPVAVIFARVTFLLALMPALRKGHPGNLVVPVYLGDAMQWNRVRPGENGKHPDMFANTDTLEIFVPALVLNDPKPRRLEEKMLSFPAAVASDSKLFDLVLDTMIDLGARSKPTEDFSAWIKRQETISDEDRNILENTYTIVRALQNEGRNHIWGYIARNLARPVWLSSEGQKADIVVGNPPWVAYRYMSTDFQKRFREECITAGIWVGGKVATQQDFSAYFYMRAAQLYMRRSGRIALIMPYSALSRRAYSAFRKGEIARFDIIEFCIQFTEAWAFGSEVSPLFKVPSCVLFANHHGGMENTSIPKQVLAFKGKLPRRDADLKEADANLTESMAPWPAIATDDDGSPYRKNFLNGATLWPRRLVIVEPAPTISELPQDPEIPIVRGRTSNQDKMPWKDIIDDLPQDKVEKEFLKPVLFGESIAPFRVFKTFQAVVPWDKKKKILMNAAMAAKSGYLHLSNWLEKTEALWEKHKRSELSFLEQCDYYGKLSCQFQIKSVRVVYTKAGTYLSSAVVRNKSVLIDHKLYWAPVESMDEAHYLCGVLNSEVLRAAVEKYQSQGQWGARDIDKYIFNLPIPRFDKDRKLHRQIANTSRKAERIADNVTTKEDEYFTAIRKRVRTALSEEAIIERLDEFTVKLLNGDDA